MISSVLLMLTLVWALYNEFFGLRPWKSYQREFARRYHSFLLKQIPKQQVGGEGNPGVAGVPAA